MSAHNRPDSAGGFAGPSHSRGTFAGLRGRGGGPSRDFASYPRRDSTGYNGPGGYGRGSFGSAREPYASRPYGPRDSFNHDARGHASRRADPYGPPNGPGFRGSTNSTSTTYPRTQRFNHLADLPKVKEGGERLPDLQDLTKADKLEEESARLRKMIDDVQVKKKAGLRDWDKSERETQTAALKSELAEEHLKNLNGESEGMSAAF